MRWKPQRPLPSDARRGVGFGSNATPVCPGRWVRQDQPNRERSLRSCAVTARCSADLSDRRARRIMEIDGLVTALERIDEAAREFLRLSDMPGSPALLHAALTRWCI